MDLIELQTDKGKETDGAWISYALGVRVKVARATTKGFMDVVQKHAKRAFRDATDGVLTEAEASQKLGPLVARYLLKDWSGIEKDGAALPYSVEVAEEILSKPEYSDFLTEIIRFAMDRNNYRAEVEEAEDRKNLETPSVGS